VQRVLQFGQIHQIKNAVAFRLGMHFLVVEDFMLSYHKWLERLQFAKCLLDAQLSSVNF
jgi:hypothetical protein